tara:strand:+ start:5087 stop:5620 length:534 start_codon:yes stop_codon:yes gene_type:complete
MSLTKSSAPVLAAAMLTAQPVQAEALRDCVSEAEVSAMVIYAVPHALRGVRTRCGANLAADGFLVTQGEQLTQRYAAFADASWDDALSGLALMAGTPDVEGTEDLRLDKMPPEIVRPLVDEMIAQKVSQMVAVPDCGRIERAVEAFAPLEPNELGQISAVILSLTGVKKPKICAVSE